MIRLARQGIAALFGLYALCAANWAVAENAGETQASQAGDPKQFGSIKVTLESFAFQGANADVMLRMDNLADEEKSIALLLFIDAQSESGIHSGRRARASTSSSKDAVAMAAI